jgi:hypothetical protein
LTVKTRKQSKVKSTVPKSTKYKIVFELPFGPLPTKDDAIKMKKQLKAKSSKVVLTATQKTSRGYTFKGRISLFKSLPMSASSLKGILQERMPSAKITVTRV